MNYPKWMYTAANNEEGYEAHLLFSREQELALGECFDTPAKIEKKKSPLFKHTVPELKEMLIAKGHDKKALNKLKEADLVKLLEEQA